jgi:iron complex outermembrane recepter protein
MNMRDRLLIAVLLGVLGVGAQDVPAQTPAEPGRSADDAVEEIVITGFRRSLDVALDAKRADAGAIDMIVAEDIADFPDLNLAEAIQRVPGVSIQRDAGEGRQISVRGLGPEFTRIRLNGIEAMSANGGTDAAGGTNRARNFDFNTFASELFNAITVRKTANASTDEGSLGATVDLRTARPFDYQGYTLVTSLTGSYNDLSEDVDPRAAALISNTFGDRFGVLLSAAYTQRGLIDEGSSAVRWAVPSGGFGALAPGYTGAATLPQLNAAFTPRIPRYDFYTHDQERLGITGALQFRPSDRTELNLDALFSRFDAERTEIFLEIPNFSSAAMGISVADAVVDGNGSIIAGTFNNVDIRSEQRFDELSTEFTQLTLNGSVALSDTLKINALVGYAESEHQNPKQTTLLFDWNNIPSLTYDFRGDDRLPLISYNGVDLTSTVTGTAQLDPMGGISTVNSNGWYLSQIRLRPQSSLNEFFNYEADLEWTLSDTFGVSVGAQLKEFTFETTAMARSNGTTANQESVIPASVAATPISQYGVPFTLGGDLGIPAGSTTTFLIPDLDQATELFGLYDTSVFRIGTEQALNNNRAVEEEDIGAFVQLNFDADLGGMSLRGNLGVRYVETDQTSSGFTFLSGAPVAVQSSRTYTDTLPALNAALGVTDEFIVRVGAAKVMSRPALGTLNPGGTVNVSGNNRVAALGNPNIDATRAEAYDLGLEWYFARESLLAVALFYKDIESRPQATSLTGQVFTGNPFGIPDSVAVAACGATPNCAPDLPIWTFNTTVNGEGGELEGFEVSYQQPFTFLPGALSNFGVILNYTGVDSEINYVNPLTGTTDTADLTGLSNSAYNATLYYETPRFGARVSAAYRDEYLDPNSGVPGRDGNNLEGVMETTTIDAAARYTLSDSVDITFEGLNLTDEFQDQWVDNTARRLSFYHHTGRNYLLGVRVKF